MSRNSYSFIRENLSKEPITFSLPMPDIKNHPQRRIVVDFNCASVQDSRYYVSFNRAKEIVKGAKLFDKQEQVFVDELLNTDFSEIVENYNIYIIEKYARGVQHNDLCCWLEDLYLRNQQNEKIISQLFKLFQCFPYETLYPVSSTLAIAGLHHQSIKIQSVVLSLLGHWCNKKALELLEVYEVPANQWVKIKYDKLKEVIKERCTILEK